jgi:hypothetical protein
MPLKIPRKAPRYKLNVKGSPWTIYVVTDAQFKRIHPDVEVRVCGLSDGDNNAIFIVDCYPKPIMLRTLFHELGHAFLSDLDAVKKVYKEENFISEELGVEAMAIGIIELLPHLNLLLDFVDKHSKEIEDVDDE